MGTVSLRLSIFYIAIFVVVGVMLPFWPVWLADKGLSGSEIGILFALPMLGKTVFAPVVAGYVDRIGQRRRPMLILTTAALCFFALCQSLDGFWFLLVTVSLFSLAWSPIMALGDNVAMMSTYGTEVQYGRLRLWGSLSFIATAALMGGFLEGGGRDHMVFWVGLGAILLTLLTITNLPDVRSSAHQGRTFPIRRLLSNRLFWLFLIAAALTNASHSFYYTFATIHWRKQGISDQIIGLLWGEGVFVEVLLFACGGWFLRKLGPTRLLALAGLGGMVRWGVLGSDPSLWGIVSVQGLHALTFGAMHLASVNFVARAVSAELSATAQSLYGAFAFGLGNGVMTLFIGRLYEHLGGQAYWGMSCLSAMGFLCAVVLSLRWRGNILVRA